MLGLEQPRGSSSTPRRLLNLVSNAIKFTDQGTIRIDLEATPEEVVVTVADTGVGIDRKDQARVFDPFTQVDQSMTRRAGGSGLGLPVSRRLAKILGGDIELESEPGKGSTFRLRLPRRPPEPADAADRADAPESRRPD